MTVKMNDTPTVLHKQTTIWASLIGLILLLAAPVYAQNYTVAPQTFGTVLDDSGRIVVGGCVWTYAAGTTTPIATYTNSTGTLNGNPIVADYAGRYTAFLLTGTNYKFVYENVPCSSSSHGTVLRTADNIAAVPPVVGNLDITGTAGEVLSAGQVVYLSDGSGSKTAGQWFKADNANTYSSTLPPLGMVPAGIASGASGTIRIAGSVTGLAGLVVGGPYYVGTGGSLTATQPVNLRRVGNADTASSLVLVASPLGFIPAIQSTSTTGNIPLLALPNTSSDHFTIYMTNATLATIQGIQAGQQGQRVTIFSTGAGQVDLSNLDAAAATGTKLLNYAQSGVTSLSAGAGSAEFVYDSSSRWRLVAHTQGDYITFTATFTTSGAPTWTAVTQTTSKYYLNGRQLTVDFEYTASTVSSAILELRSSIPFTVASRSAVQDRIIDNGGAAAMGGTLAQTGDAFIRHYVSLTEAANWTASATNTQTRGVLAINVQ